MRAVLAAALLCAALAGPDSGLAQDLPPTVRLSFDAPPGIGCPAEGVVRRDVGRCLAPRTVFIPRPLHVEARIVRRDGALMAQARFVEADGTPRGYRELPARGRSCQALARNLVVVLCFALDRYAEDVPPEPPRMADLRRAGGGAARRARRGATDAPARSAPARSPRINLLLGPTLTGGALPGAAFGGLLGLEAEWPRWSLLFEVRGDSTLSFETWAGAVRAHAIHGSVAVCGRLPSQMRLCALLSAGARLAGSHDFPALDEPEQAEGVPEDPGQAVVPFLAGGVRLAFQRRLAERIGLRIRLEILALPSPSRIRYWLRPRQEASYPQPDIHVLQRPQGGFVLHTLWEPPLVSFSLGVDLLAGSF